MTEQSTTSSGPDRRRPPARADPGADLDTSLSALAEAGPFAVARLLADDLADRFPTAACEALDSLGCHRFYVPAIDGGCLTSHPVAHEHIRSIARRDLTVAIAHGKTYLGAVSVWVDGSADQRAELARHVLDRGLVAWGLTERDHGSDLGANELSAAPIDGGWRLNGEKWVINNATRAEMICVLARTDAAGGPRGHSLFLVDKRHLAPDTYRCLPKIRTYGIRGADISGIAFRDAVITDDRVVGRVGRGLQTVLRALQLTRAACPWLSLGAVDHAIAIATRFIATRELAAELGRVERQNLGRVIARSLLVERVATFASRCVHTLSQEMSVISSVVKALVPTVADDVITQLSWLLGPYGLFDDRLLGDSLLKVERDHRIVAIFDGSTAVNRAALISHFPRLEHGYGVEIDHEGLGRAADGELALPTLDPSRLRLTSPRCSPVAALPTIVAALAPSLAPATLTRARRLEVIAARLHTRMRDWQPGTTGVPAAAFAVAERYELVFAAGACLQLRGAGSILSPDDDVLDACLTAALEGLDETLSDADLAVYERCAESLLDTTVEDAPDEW